MNTYQIPQLPLPPLSRLMLMLVAKQDLYLQYLFKPDLIGFLKKLSFQI